MEQFSLIELTDAELDLVAGGCTLALQEGNGNINTNANSVNQDPNGLTKDKANGAVITWVL
jgi:hypothetical protein